MTYVGSYETKLLVYKKFIKENKRIHTHAKLENGLM